MLNQRSIAELRKRLLTRDYNKPQASDEISLNSRTVIFLQAKLLFKWNRCFPDERIQSGENMLIRFHQLIPLTFREQRTTTRNNQLYNDWHPWKGDGPENLLVQLLAPLHLIFEAWSLDVPENLLGFWGSNFRARTSLSPWCHVAWEDFQIFWSENSPCHHR